MDLWESFERYMDERTKCNNLKKKTFPNPVNLHRVARPGLTNFKFGLSPSSSPSSVSFSDRWSLSGYF